MRILQAGGSCGAVYRGGKGKGIFPLLPEYILCDVAALRRLQGNLRRRDVVPARHIGGGIFAIIGCNVIKLRRSVERRTVFFPEKGAGRCVQAELFRGKSALQTDLSGSIRLDGDGFLQRDACVYERHGIFKYDRPVRGERTQAHGGVACLDIRGSPREGFQLLWGGDRDGPVQRRAVQGCSCHLKGEVFRYETVGDADVTRRGAGVKIGGGDVPGEGQGAFLCTGKGEGFRDGQRVPVGGQRQGRKKGQRALQGDVLEQENVGRLSVRRGRQTRGGQDISAVRTVLGESDAVVYRCLLFQRQAFRGPAARRGGQRDAAPFCRARVQGECRVCVCIVVEGKAHAAGEDGLAQRRSVFRGEKQCVVCVQPEAGALSSAAGYEGGDPKEQQQKKACQ